MAAFLNTATGLDAFRSAISIVDDTDRRSANALRSLLAHIETDRIDVVYEEVSGRVPLASIRCYVDDEMPPGEEIYFDIGGRGVDLQSTLVRQTGLSIWVMADRWADSLVVASRADAAFEDITITKAFWD